MLLTDSFVVPVTADRLWEVLTDVERIAPCIPGFELREANDPEYRGAMKVKVGAISVSYDVTVLFTERHDAERRAVLSVKGRESRGAGGITATVTSRLTDRGDDVLAEMTTDVQVTGRVAQFGRGIIADVSSRVVEQFVSCLNERILAAPPPSPDGTIGSTQATAEQRPPAAQSAPLDLGSVATLPMLKRLGPVVLCLLVLVLLVRRRARQER